jgi:hypothetical protein
MFSKSSYLTSLLYDEDGFEKSSTTVGRNTLDSLGRDLLVGVLESASTATPIDVLEAGAKACSATSLTAAEIRVCDNDPSSLLNAVVALAYANGSVSTIDLPLPKYRAAMLPPTLAESVPNQLQALSAVIRMDIGNWDNTSIFVSPHRFNATIARNAAISKVLSQHPSIVLPQQPKVSSASQLRAQPEQTVVPVEDRTHAIIAMSYLCHEQRMKSPFNLIICKPSLISWVDASLNHCLLPSCCRCRCVHVRYRLGSIYGHRFVFCVSGGLSVASENRLFGEGVMVSMNAQ